MTAMTRQEAYDRIMEEVKTLCGYILTMTETVQLISAIEDVSNPIERFEFLRRVAEDLARMVLEGGQPESMLEEINKKFEPVDVATFIKDPYYLNLANEVYPEVLKGMEELNNGTYVEAVLTGGIGSAKTTMAIWTTAYQVYLLSALVDPHMVFGLAKTDEIVMVLQSITGKKAKELDYARLKNLIHRTPYFNDEFPYDKGIDSQLLFPNRICVKHFSGDPSAAIGENVIGGVIDEINFMAKVENSKQSKNGTTFDQAMEMYNSILRRRESRFMKGGQMYGMLCLVSSKNYPGQFTDIKEEEAQRQKEELGRSNIFVWDKRVWEVKPEGNFSTETFNLFIGDSTREARILNEGEQVAEEDRHLVMPIPMDFRDAFRRDPIGALRDVAGVSTLATNPFIADRDSVQRNMNHDNLFLCDEANFKDKKLQFIFDRIENPHEPRAVHIDLSKTKDGTGVVIGHLKGFKKVLRGDSVEVFPEIHIDAAVAIKAVPGAIVPYFKIRELLYKLRDKGLNIKWVTFDSYQSTDSVVVLRSKGFITGLVSMDTSNGPYHMVRDALFDDRLNLPRNTLLLRELLRLDYDVEKDKIDHPPDFSKDIADAVAGVTYMLTTRRELWQKHKVDFRLAGQSVRDAMSKDKIEERDAKAKAAMDGVQ